MTEATATPAGQTAAPTSAGTDTPANGTSGQQTNPSPAQTSPGDAAAPTSAPAKDVFVAKVFGHEIPVDISDRQRVQELIQKGLAFDTSKEKFEERANARAQEIIREQQQRQAEEQRLAQLREADPLAYEFENYRKTDAEKAQALEQRLNQLGEHLSNLTFQQQLAEVKRQYSDLNQRDMNRAFAEVVASKGQTNLMEAARLVKEEKETLRKELRDSLLQELKTTPQGAAPTVPSGGSGTPNPAANPQSGLSFSNKDGIKAAVEGYLKSVQGGG